MRLLVLFVALMALLALPFAFLDGTRREGHAEDDVSWRDPKDYDAVRYAPARRYLERRDRDLRYRRYLEAQRATRRHQQNADRSDGWDSLWQRTHLPGAARPAKTP